MVKNYLIATFRNITKSKFLSILNIGGLSIGLASSLLILQYVIWEKSFDYFHEHSENIYRVSQLFLKEGQLDFHAGATFASVGPILKEDFPEVLDYCRFLRKWRGGMVSYAERTFRENDLVYVDPSFFKLFSYPLLSGNPETVLSQPHTAVIDRSTAEKYFQNEDPVGKRIKVSSMDGEEEFEITGVFESTPNSHVKFNLLISYSSAVSVFGSDVERSWGWWDFHTYIRLRDQSDPVMLESQFPAFADKYGGERRGSNRVGFKLQPITAIHLHSNLRHELSQNGNAQTVDFLLIISIFIIVIAWMNYVNLITARSLNRAKEVGIRKVLGSNRKQLTHQFLIESMVINALSIIIALILFQFALPWFYDLIGKQLPVNYFNQPYFWITIFAFWSIGSIASGFYPALILSSFKPIQALKSGLTPKTGKASYRKALVILQFVISSTLITGTLLVYQQISYMQSVDKGINTESVVTIPAPEVMLDASRYRNKLNTFRDRLTLHNAVSKVSLTSDIPGQEVGWMGSMIKVGSNQGDQPSTIIYKHTLDRTYLDLFENKFISGRNFNKSSDSTYVILNRSAMQSIGFTNPEEAINQQVFISLVDTMTILGVIEDFHQETLKSDFKPTVYLMIEEERRHFAAKVNTSELSDFIKYAAVEFKSVFPEGVFEFQYLNDFIHQQYRSEQNFLSTFVVFASLAIFIALLGLIGLTFYATEQRKKEISIRKILGSSQVGIFGLLTKSIVGQVLLANLVAIPVAYYFGNDWLDGFAFRMDFPYLLPIVTITITLICAFTIISYHILKAARVNPVLALRND